MLPTDEALETGESMQTMCANDEEDGERILMSSAKGNASLKQLRQLRSSGSANLFPKPAKFDDVKRDRGALNPSISSPPWSRHHQLHPRARRGIRSNGNGR
jgi:hypothetical protein